MRRMGGGSCLQVHTGDVLEWYSKFVFSISYWYMIVACGHSLSSLVLKIFQFRFSFSFFVNA